MRRVRETTCVSNLIDWLVFEFEEIFGSFQAAFVQKLDWRFPEQLPKLPHEVKFAHSGLFGQACKIDRIGGQL